jgi:hypothetical protein
MTFSLLMLVGFVAPIALMGALDWLARKRG